MTGDDQSDDYEPNIEPANGSFYHAYKKQLLSFANTIEGAGTKALDNPSLKSADKCELEVGLDKLRSQCRDLQGLLSKIINESDPSFFEECTVAAIMEMVTSVFLISKHLRLTDSAIDEALKRQANIAREGRARSLSKGKAARIELVTRHAKLVGADLRQPYKAAEAIRDAVNAERAKAGKPGVTVRAIQNWIKEAGLGINSENS